VLWSLCQRCSVTERGFQQRLPRRFGRRRGCASPVAAASAADEIGFQRPVVLMLEAGGVGDGRHVPALGERGDQAVRVGALDNGVLVWDGGITKPDRAGGCCDLGGYGFALAVGKGTVNVGGEPRPGLAVLARCGGGGLKASQATHGQHRFGGVPVSRVPGVAGLGVGAEDLAGVVTGHLVLLAVGGDDANVPEPFACVFGVGWGLAEQAHPRWTVPDGGVG